MIGALKSNGGSPSNTTTPASNFPISPFSNCIPSGSPPNGFFASLTSKLLTTLGRALVANDTSVCFNNASSKSPLGTRGALSDISLPEPVTGKSSSVTLSPVLTNASSSNTNSVPACSI